jgi:hypothetical protein
MDRSSSFHCDHRSYAKRRSQEKGQLRQAACHPGMRFPGMRQVEGRKSPELEEEGV